MKIRIEPNDGLTRGFGVIIELWSDIAFLFWKWAVIIEREVKGD